MAERTFLQIRIDKDIRDSFKEVCSDNAVNPSALIRKWITEYIEKEKK